MPDIPFYVICIILAGLGILGTLSGLGPDRDE